MERLERACEIDVHRGEGLIDPAELHRRVAGKQGLVCLLTDPIDRKAIDAGRDLRVIANIAVGFDNIDVPYAHSRGIVVTNTPDVLTDAVADFTWGLILAVTRRLVEGDRLVRRGGWTGWALDFMLGAELRGKQLGVVGFGQIGRAVARRAPAFGMRVVFTGRESGARQTAAGQSAGANDAVAVSLDELLVGSDVVTLHVPATPDTRHLIDQRALARMKRTAYLVNTSRGSVVDEAALAWALEGGLIAGAALDVYEREPAIHPSLVALENVVLAPHLASATVETRTAMAELAVRNVIEVLAGRPALTPVAS
jgi:lactate dehydrogenase-like 2-hydroxyacid dehydrogenase